MRLRIRFLLTFAAGVLAAVFYGEMIEEPNLVSFDMGGTTAKMCVIQQGEPTMSDNFEVARVHRFKRGSGLPVRVPTIELIEIGAGGGSEARNAEFLSALENRLGEELGRDVWEDLMPWDDPEAPTTIEDRFEYGALTGGDVVGSVPIDEGSLVPIDVVADGDFITQGSPIEVLEIRGNRISMIFQEPMTSLNPVFTVGEQVGELLLPPLAPVDGARQAGALDTDMIVRRRQQAVQVNRRNPPEGKRNSLCEHESGNIPVSGTSSGPAAARPCSTSSKESVWRSAARRRPMR
mgnify:CR=1 FL=1